MTFLQMFPCWEKYRERKENFNSNNNNSFQDYEMYNCVFTWVSVQILIRKFAGGNDNLPRTNRLNFDGIRKKIR